jgi:two-component system, OmpR family, sensor histidine kinase ChvG
MSLTRRHLGRRGEAPGDSAIVNGLEMNGRGTILTDMLNAAWDGLARILAPDDGSDPVADPKANAQALVQTALAGGSTVKTTTDSEGRSVFAVATPILQAVCPWASWR